MRCDCGTEFVFRKHVETGKAAPIEAVPADNGNIRLLRGGLYEVLSGDRLANADPPLYLNHYATCSTRRRR